MEMKCNSEKHLMHPREGRSRGNGRTNGTNRKKNNKMLELNATILIIIVNIPLLNVDCQNR